MKPTILIAEKDDFLRRLLKEELRDGTCIVREAADDAQAIDILRQGNIGLLLLDVGLPKHGGMHLLRELRERKSPVDVVVLSSHDDVSLRNESAALCACDFLVKGNMEWIDVTERIRRHIPGVRHLFGPSVRIGN